MDDTKERKKWQLSFSDVQILNTQNPEVHKIEIYLLIYTSMN